jgi:hypothetical protein
MGGYYGESTEDASRSVLARHLPGAKTHPEGAASCHRAWSDNGVASDDRFFAEQRPVQPIQARRAARHLLDCSGLSSAIKDFGSFEPHEAYEARLRRDHRRKSSFWSSIDREADRNSLASRLKISARQHD